MMKMSPILSEMVAQFHDAGGAGDFTVHGRVIAGSPAASMPGDLVAWMTLVAQGLVAGEGGRLFLTEIGRNVAAAIMDGRTRSGA